MTPTLRTRAVQDAVCAIVWYIAALAVYLAPIGPDWLYLLPAAMVAWNLVDLVGVVVLGRRTNDKTW